MKRFNYKFEKIKVIKEYLELEAKLNYAKILQKKIDIDNENIFLQKSIMESMTEDYSQNKEGDILNYVSLNMEGQFVNSCLKKISQNNDKKITIEIELKNSLEKLKAAMKERKKYELLKDNELIKYKKEYNKEETKKIDEVANNMSIIMSNI